LAHIGQDRYQIQVASFSTQDEAQQLARLLRDKGYRPAIAEFLETAQTWHRVIVGPFPSKDEARQVGAQIEKALRVTPMVVQTSVR
jgi:cell division septation protein DedD